MFDLAAVAGAAQLLACRCMALHMLIAWIRTSALSGCHRIVYHNFD